MKELLSIPIKFLFVSIGLILLSALTGLFRGGARPEWELYTEQVRSILVAFVHPEKLTVTTLSGKEYPFFQDFWDVYSYSLAIFLPALFLSLFLSLLLTYLTILLPDGIRRRITRTAALLESTPDLLIIMIIQGGALYIMRETGVLLFSVAATASDPTYILPIIALSLIPSLMFYKVTLYLVNDEFKEPYIDLIRSKGFTESYIFYRHILRNIAPSLFTHSKAILLLLLSSMVIFERIFNIPGIFTYLIRFPEPDVIAVSLIAFYVPIFLLYAIVTGLIGRSTGQRLEW
ncbi:ABC transporter permease subunit [Indiicoccus explosivorum]|uniref:ABC transporter permease subunit n=1 Tax=Indiicoccus explosivorum TaxID=1917864 RepID=UPI000B44BD66|nr:ABC transporter permease subunit [Indiicoccus explosivorum]